MNRKFSLLAIVAVLVLIVSAWGGMVAAQDETSDEQPFLGVGLEETDSGVTITQVVPGSAADDAGLMAGDIITEIDGTAVESAEQVVESVRASSPGDIITVTVERDGETLEIEATLGTRTPQPETRFRAEPEAQPFLGIRLEDSDAGAIIADVIADSPADDAGLMTGDVITAVDDTEITSAEEVIQVVQSAEPGDSITITVERDGETLEIEAALGEVPQPTVRSFRLGGDQIVYLPDEGAWEVRELAEDSPLAEAGLQVGDRITEINGQSFALDNLRELLPEIMPGGPVVLTVERDGETLEIEVPSTALLSMLGPGFGIPGRQERGDAIPFGGLPFTNRARLGVMFQTIDEQVAETHELDVTDGAYIVEVQEDSPAETAGLQVGDVITAVDGDVVDFERTLADRLYAYEPGDTITLDVLRDGESLQIEVTLGQPVQSSDRFHFFGPGEFPGENFFRIIPRPPENEGTPLPETEGEI